MHPAMIVLLSVLLRAAGLWFALERVLGLSLAGGGHIFWQHLPALTLLYFALGPKPKANAWRYVSISTLVYAAGVLALMVEALRWHDFAGSARELVLLTVSVVSHFIYASWKNRDETWGRWQLV